MALSAAPLIDMAQRLHSPLKTAEQLQAALDFQYAERVLALGIPALDDVLPQRGLLQGSVIELQVRGASGAATSFALCACRAAQRGAASWGACWGACWQAAPASAAVARGVESPREWCAFIDPSASLFAPGVARLGVALDRLLVVRPDIGSVERVAIRIAEAKAVSLLVIDLRGALGDLRVSSHRWQRTVRRLALVVKRLSTCVLLITPAEPRQALPLPVAMRLEFARASANSFEIRVGKERSGRVASAREVPWSAFDEVWQ
jgi:recombination protein RecA